MSPSFVFEKPKLINRFFPFQRIQFGPRAIIYSTKTACNLEITEFKNARSSTPKTFSIFFTSWCIYVIFYGMTKYVNWILVYLRTTHLKYTSAKYVIYLRKTGSVSFHCGNFRTNFSGTKSTKFLIIAQNSQLIKINIIWKFIKK